MLAVTHNLPNPLCTSLPIPILLSLFPPPRPLQREGFRNEPELIGNQKQLPGQGHWCRISCRGSGGGGWLPRQRGGCDGRGQTGQGVCPGWLLGSAIAIGRVLKPLGGFPYERVCGCGSLRMSPARTVPPSNSRSLTKQPFTGIITPPPLRPHPLTHTHTTSALCFHRSPAYSVEPPRPQKKGIPPLSH